jgi:hypothetical protein
MVKATLPNQKGDAKQFDSGVNLALVQCWVSFVISGIQIFLSSPCLIITSRIPNFGVARKFASEYRE